MPGLPLPSEESDETVPPAVSELHRPTESLEMKEGEVSPQLRVVAEDIAESVRRRQSGEGGCLEEGEQGQEGLVAQPEEAVVVPRPREEERIAVGPAAVGVAGLEVVGVELPHGECEAMSDESLRQYREKGNHLELFHKEVKQAWRSH